MPRDRLREPEYNARRLICTSFSLHPWQLAIIREEAFHQRVSQSEVVRQALDTVFRNLDAAADNGEVQSTPRVGRSYFTTTTRPIIKELARMRAEMALLRGTFAHPDQDD